MSVPVATGTSNQHDLYDRVEKNVIELNSKEIPIVSSILFFFFFPAARRARSSKHHLHRDVTTRCIRGEVDVGEETEQSRGSSPATATRDTIRIAMRRHGWRMENGEETGGNERSRADCGRNVVETARKEARAEEEEDGGANDGLDFTLNCSSVRLMYRDARHGASWGEKRQRAETRN